MTGRIIKRASGSARRRPLAALLAVLGIAAVGVWGAVALAASAPPTPALSESPNTSPTTSATETFTFTDSQSGVTFQCSLNGSAFSACTSPKTYSGLTDGSYSFAVRAVKGSSTSSSATYSWVVDRTAPTLSSINRAGSSPTNAASVSWTVTFSESVKNVATSNFTLASNGLAGSPAITGLSGSGSTYTVTASTGSGSGSLGLNYSSKGTITDQAGNPIATNPPVSGQVYTIDRTPPPNPTITAGPANGSLTNQNSASFSFMDSEAGATFLCRLDSGSYAACSSPASYSGLADGGHTFSVEAKDAAGNVSGPASSTWTVDRTPPPRPTVNSGPSQKWDSSTVTFTFSDSEAGVSFQCNMDLSTTPGWQPCTSPKSYFNMTAGTHEFDVRAVDAAGNVGDYTGWKWTENGQTGTGQPFTIDGNVVGLLYPGGATRSIAVTLHNPNSVAIYVSSLTVGYGTMPVGCLSSWFTLGQSNISSSNMVTVPANGSVTLPHANSSNTGTVTAPTIRMNDNGIQDACKGKSFTLTYTGSANS